MPVMDGFTATRELRARGVKTADRRADRERDDGFEKKMLDAGCNGYLTKPIDIDALLGTLAKLLGGERIDAEVQAADPPVAAERAPEPEPEAAALAQGAPITSRLAAQPRMQPIVRKFVGRLRERLDEAATAQAGGDLVALADFAHWLKGSAGSMGYDYFTEPAAELEKAAKAGERERSGQLLGELRLASARVVPPGEETLAA